MRAGYVGERVLRPKRGRFLNFHVGRHEFIKRRIIEADCPIKLSL